MAQFMLNLLNVSLFKTPVSDNVCLRKNNELTLLLV